MLISLIVAMAKNRVIGHAGTIPWHLPEDLRWFRKHTMGHCLLMGRRTFETINKALPGRRTLVLSRDPDYRAAGCLVVADIPAALRCAEPAQRLFVCGGGDVYRQTLPLAGRIYLTELDIDVDGDTFFPEFQKDDFQLIHQENRTGKINYRFSVLQRKAPFHPFPS